MILARIPKLLQYRSRRVALAFAYGKATRFSSWTRTPSYVSRHRKYKYKVYKVALTKDRQVVGRLSH